MITKPAPNKITYLPEYSLPNINPSPIPPIIPTVSPVLSSLSISFSPNNNLKTSIGL